MKTLHNAHEQYNAKPQIIPTLFVFFLMFSVEIAGISLKYPFLIIIFVIVSVFSGKIVNNTDVSPIPISIGILLIYSTTIMIINQRNNTFELLRFIRCLVSFFSIDMFISCNKYNRKDILKSLIFVLILHSIAIILGIIYPSFKELIVPISQYNKSFLRYRSTGLLSGYDDAGFLCNVGLILNYTIQKDENRNGLNYQTLLFIIASALSSRFNMLCMAIIMFIIVGIESKGKKIIHKILALVIALIGGGIALLFWILTTNVNPSLKSSLLASYPQLNLLYNNLISSYVDYGVYTNAINRHWKPEEIGLFECIFGKGVRTERTDIGYVKSMYSYGIIGIIVELLVYFSTCIRLKNRSNTIGEKYCLSYFFIIVLMFVMEAKTAVVFSSTTFEMITIIYLTLILPHDQNESQIKEYT